MTTNEKINNKTEKILVKEDSQQKNQTTGFPSLDKVTTGLVDGSFVVIASRPGMGKSSFALDIAKNIDSNTEKTVVIFSLEMSEKGIKNRLQRKNSNTTLEKSNILIKDDPHVTVKDMERTCEEIKNLGAVIIDYMQLVFETGYPDREKSRGEEMLYISRLLKQMANKLNVPVICSSQLTRYIDYRKDKRPTLKDFDDNALLSQFPDQILFLYRDSYYNNLNQSAQYGDIMECIVAKNHYGELGTIQLQWNQDSLSFVEIDK